MEFQVRALTGDELRFAGAVAARALRDNPMMAFSVPDDPLARLQVGYDTFVERIAPDSVGAVVGRHVIGVAAAAAPGVCIGATAASELRRAPAMDPADAVGYDRARFVISTMCEHDPEERHVHVGPVGVEPGVQGLGIGRAMMTAVCERLDDDGEAGWLETDKPENVVFYRRHGFDVAAEDRHLGISIWFMRRPPR
jgi:ribosomal protein S18 acetylase RimI-like enzyme